MPYYNAHIRSPPSDLDPRSEDPPSPNTEEVSHRKWSRRGSRLQCSLPPRQSLDNDEEFITSANKYPSDDGACDFPGWRRLHTTYPRSPQAWVNAVHSALLFLPNFALSVRSQFGHDCTVRVADMEEGSLENPSASYRGNVPRDGATTHHAHAMIPPLMARWLGRPLTARADPTASSRIRGVLGWAVPPISAHKIGSSARSMTGLVKRVMPSGSGVSTPGGGTGLRAREVGGPASILAQHVIFLFFFFFFFFSILFSLLFFRFQIWMQILVVNFSLRLHVPIKLPAWRDILIYIYSSLYCILFSFFLLFSFLFHLQILSFKLGFTPNFNIIFSLSL
jgi:hypothetical protein